MLVYFILGILFAAVQLLAHQKLQKLGKAKIWPNEVLALIANFLIIFSLAWGYDSILEQEMQAAMVGLIFFGGMGIVFAVILYRLVTKDSKVVSKENSKVGA